MKFLTIIATVFWCGTVRVGADYYIEFRGPPVITNARGQSIMSTFIYDCKGIPTGRKSYEAGRSQCTQVTSLQDKITIYYNCNFYKVYRPDFQGHGLHLPRSAMPYEWFLGYMNHNIDHPNFAVPTQSDVTSFRNRLRSLSLDNAVPAYLVKGVAVFFAQNNLIAFAGNPTQANSHFLGFATFLSKIMEGDRAVEEETVQSRFDSITSQLDMLINMALEKLIDPCAVLLGNLQAYASRYCTTYCDFLSFVSVHFNTCASRCSSLQGGHCVGSVCTCNRVITHPFAGCDNAPTSPMQFCFNSMRSELNL